MFLDLFNRVQFDLVRIYLRVVSGAQVMDIKV